MRGQKSAVGGAGGWDLREKEKPGGTLRFLTWVVGRIATPLTKGRSRFGEERGKLPAVTLQYNFSLVSRDTLLNKHTSWGSNQLKLSFSRFAKGTDSLPNSFNSIPQSIWCKKNLNQGRGTLSPQKGRGLEPQRALLCQPQAAALLPRPAAARVRLLSGGCAALFTGGTAPPGASRHLTSGRPANECLSGL